MFEGDDLVLDTSFLAALEYRRSPRRELVRRAIDASRVLQLVCCRILSYWNELGHRLAAERLVDEMAILIRAAEPR